MARPWTLPARSTRGGRLRIAIICFLIVAVPPAAACTTPSEPPPSLPPPRTVVSLTFNDGHLGQFEYAAPVLDAHGLRATFYVASGWIDNAWPCCMHWWQLDELYRAGHEIGGMGAEHQVLTTEPTRPWPEERDERRRQVCRDRDRLVALGYDPVSFAYPEGTFITAFPDVSTPQDIVRSCGYFSARAVGGLGPYSRTANWLPPPDPFGVLTPDVVEEGPVQLDWLQQAVVDADHGGGGWLPFAFDRVCRRGTPEYEECMASPRALDDSTLDAFLRWLQTAGQPDGAPAGTAVKTVREVLGTPPPPPLPPRQTVVSLTFDDGDKSQYLVRPVLFDRGMHATFYISTGLVDRDDGSAMTWEQLRGLASDGHDIGGDTVHHVNLTQLPPAAKRDEICTDRARLVDKGFAAVSFGYPYGQFDAESRELVASCGYSSARAAGGVSPGGPQYSELLPPPDPFATEALDAGDGPISLAYLQSAVESAAAHGGGWVQIITHGVCRASDPNYATCMGGHRPVDLGVFTEFVSWLEGRAPPNTVVRSVAEVMGGH